MEVTFGDCLIASARIPEFVENFDRLTGSQLSQIARRTPIEQMIDSATGRDREQILLFMAFVYEVVYLRYPDAVPE